MTDLVSPRPRFENKEKRGEKNIVLGTSTAGIVVRITKEGMELNGYYKSFYDADTMLGNMRDFVFISWADIEIFRQSLTKKKGGPRIIVEEPDEIAEPTQEYLNSLPQVTLNGMKFYIDPEKRERRPVSNPSHVFHFDKALKG